MTYKVVTPSRSPVVASVGGIFVFIRTFAQNTTIQSSYNSFFSGYGKRSKLLRGRVI